MTDALAHLVADGNEVLYIKLVRQPSDIDDDETTFGPEMCHQVFGANENIFGYTDLQINLFYTAGSLQTYVGIQYSEKINPADFNGVKADDIEKQLSDVLAPNYLTNIDDFVKCIDKEDNFTPYGTLEHAFTTEPTDGAGRTRKFEVYFCDTTTPGFLAYHQRLQTFLLWYVDAASFIDIDDDQWTFFIVYEKYTTSEGIQRYATAGYGTVYRYYAYPDHIRPRISQVLILPPFRRMGLASQLLQAIYLHYQLVPNVVDITVEDPSTDFQRIRDYIDAKNCKSLPAFQPEQLEKGFSKDMATQAQSKLKINARQARRVYEILRLANTNTSDLRHYQRYRLDVKNRLNAPFQKKKNEMKKLQKILKGEEFSAALSMVGLDETQSRLANHYKTVEDEYKRVLNRLQF